MTVAEQSIHDAVASAESLGWLAAYLQESGNESAEDLVLDGLDLLTGWCGPGRQIVPSPAR